ncbi:MAG: 50S ribosomal protein L9 [Bacteroidota bacterium]|nr:50S ribosomal protein L9 [Bacteroidota bacterium]
MELILKENVENLGFKGDVVKVKSGYGRNFLIPKGKAVLATTSSKKILKENIKQQEFKDKKIIEEVTEFGKKLKKLKIKISSKVSESDKLFGSVTSSNLSEAFEAKGHTVEKNLIAIPGKNIKRLGNYEATIRLHREVSIQIPFDVIAEKK